MIPTFKVVFTTMETLEIDGQSIRGMDWKEFNGFKTYMAAEEFILQKVSTIKGAIEAEIKKVYTYQGELL